MKKFIATLKKAVKSVEEGNKLMANNEALSPRSFYLVKRPVCF